MFFADIRTSIETDLAEQLLQNQDLELSDGPVEKGYCLNAKKRLRTCLSSVISQRILALACGAIALVSGVYKTRNDFTAGVFDKSLGRFSEGRYLSATLLSCSLGGFSAASFEFFAQTICSPLSLYLIDSIMLTALPIILGFLIQDELNDINPDYTIKDTSVYENDYTAMFSICIAATIVELFFKLRKPQEDERWDLTSIDALHHPWMNKKVRYMALTPTTNREFKIYDTIGTTALGLGCVGMAVISQNVKQLNVSTFEVVGVDGQSYLFFLAAMYLTAGPTARYLYLKLTRAIKKHQKRVQDDPQTQANTLAHGIRLLMLDYSNGIAALAWTSILQYGLNNLAARWFTFFFFSWEGAGENLRFSSGADPAFTIAPHGGETVEAVIKLIPPATSIGCRSLRLRIYLPRNRSEWTGMGYRNFDKILKVTGGLFMLTGTVWFAVNSVEATQDWQNGKGSGVKMAAAITSTISLPAWYATKVWVDLTYTDASGQWKNGLKYLTTYRPAPLMLPGLLINQIYGKINSLNEDNEGNKADYFWNVLANISLMAPYGLTLASAKQLNQSVVILIFLAMSAKWSKGDN